MYTLYKLQNNKIAERVALRKNTDRGSYAGNVCEHLFVTPMLIKTTMHSIKLTVMQ